MNVISAEVRRMMRLKLIRIIVLVNFALLMFGVVLSRLGGNAVDRFLRNAGLDSAAALDSHFDPVCYSPFHPAHFQKVAREWIVRSGPASGTG
jgi:hypothetical protein